MKQPNTQARLVRISTWIAISALSANLVEPVYQWLHTLWWSWGDWYIIRHEFRYSGLSTLTIAAMIVLIRWNKTVVATACGLFSFTGFWSAVDFGFDEYGVDDLKWAVPFLVACISLVVGIRLERPK
ncbi:MAG: hypothetical protein AAFO93_04295 [Pseudomonadota bacterium]